MSPFRFTSFRQRPKLWSGTSRSIVTQITPDPFAGPFSAAPKATKTQTEDCQVGKDGPFLVQNGSPNLECPLCSLQVYNFILFTCYANMPNFEFCNNSWSAYGTGGPNFHHLRFRHQVLPLRRRDGIRQTRSGRKRHQETLADRCWEIVGMFGINVQPIFPKRLTPNFGKPCKKVDWKKNCPCSQSQKLFQCRSLFECLAL